MGRFDRWFALLSAATFAAALGVGLLNMPTNDKLERAFVRRIVTGMVGASDTAAILHESPDEMVEDIYREDIGSQGSLDKWAHEIVGKRMPEIRSRAESALSDAEHSGDSAAIAEARAALSVYSTNLDIWNREYASLQRDRERVAYSQASFVLRMLALAWALPPAIIYTLARGVRWAMASKPAFVNRKSDLVSSAPSGSKQTPDTDPAEMHVRAFAAQRLWPRLLATAMIMLPLVWASARAAIVAAGHGEGSAFANWWILSLGEVLAGYTLAFGLAYIVLRRQRSFERFRTAGAFLLGWNAIPAACLVVLRRPLDLGSTLLLLDLIAAVVALWLSSSARQPAVTNLRAQAVDEAPDAR